jgi:hypothetical protein
MHFATLCNNNENHHSIASQSFIYATGYFIFCTYDQAV